MNSKKSYLLISIIIFSLVCIPLIIFDLNKTKNNIPIRFVTYNIDQYYYAGNGSDNTMNVYNALKQVNADIIGLQEAEGARAPNSVVILARDLHMTYIYFNKFNSSQLIGLTILSKYKILSYNYIKLPSPNSPRYVISAEILTPDGIINVFDTHFDTYPYVTLRYDQAKSLVNFTKSSTNALILGDFNTGPFSNDSAFSLLNSTFKDSWNLAGSNWINHTSPLYTPFERIDYIWVKGDISVIKNSFSVFGNESDSDHVGLYVDILF